MFQNFDDPPSAADSAPHIAALRAEIVRLGLDGFILPRTDEHLGEDIPASAERLAWLTGFTGSAGTAIVLADKAAIFVDGRYTIQVENQVDQDVIEPVASMETSPAAWLADHAGDGQRIGYDPWLMSARQVEKLTERLADKGAELIAVDTNPIDRLWNGRPDAPDSPVSVQDSAFTGKSALDKIAELQEALKENGTDGVILTDATSSAWLFNIRGGDVPHTPIVQAFAAVPQSGRPTLFLDSNKLPTDVGSALSEDCDIASKQDLLPFLQDFGAESAEIQIDKAAAASAIAAAIEAAGGIIVDRPDPVALPRACKTAEEIKGAKSAHRRDGAAMVQFLAWLDRNGEDGLGEIEVAKALEGFRVSAGEQDIQPLVDISFDTISATGPNGALPHYRVTEGTNRTLQVGDLIVVDSGGQYRDGTTDITRTFLVGGPGPDFDLKRDRFTRVLKGHIAIATARFPSGTSGAQLDALARQYLWRAGLDFDHGTGHGVGSFLSVHEGPHRISKSGSVALKPGMIVSNEPGFYLNGAFGIRIENLIVVTEPGPPPGGDRSLFAFEDLTLAPIDRRLIAPHLMTPSEVAWLDLYHQRVYASLSGWPGLTDDERAFLGAACRPIAV